MEESFKYHIPEDIPANERTAFHGAAAAAAKDGKKNFNFGGKTHPVTMNKGLANKIADQKESMSFREKLLSLYENDRAKHYKGATEPETEDDKLKGAGAKQMKADLTGGDTKAADMEKQSHADASKAGRAGPGTKTRTNDNKKGDKKAMTSATPVNDPTAKIVKTEAYGISGNKISSNLLDAVSMVEDMNKVHTVDIDHMTGTAGSHEKKHGITLKKSKNYDNTRGMMATDATGTKANLQKYLKKHYDGDHKTMHPEIYKESVSQVTEKMAAGRTHRVKGDRTMHDQHAQTGFGMGAKQTYAGMHGMNQGHYAKYISKKSGHDSYFDGHDLVHSKSSKTVVSNALHGKHTPDQLADKMKAHGDKHKG